MTADQLALDDCEPNWDDLCDQGAEQLHAPADKPHRDLRGQRLSVIKKHRITTIHTTGEYL